MLLTIFAYLNVIDSFKTYVKLNAVTVCLHVYHKLSHPCGYFEIVGSDFNLEYSAVRNSRQFLSGKYFNRLHTTCNVLGWALKLD